MFSIDGEDERAHILKWQFWNGLVNTDILPFQKWLSFYTRTTHDEKQLILIVGCSIFGGKFQYICIVLEAGN